LKNKISFDSKYRNTQRKLAKERNPTSSWRWRYVSRAVRKKKFIYAIKYNATFDKKYPKAFGVLNLTLRGVYFKMPENLLKATY